MGSRLQGDSLKDIGIYLQDEHNRSNVFGTLCRQLMGRRKKYKMLRESEFRPIPLANLSMWLQNELNIVNNAQEKKFWNWK
ncbi:unnamed protein product [Adineta steineri]|uniref:Uncharacterized protein n=1 Tax=Adineta steineri TaxID=433720 RepID=A0A815REQ3_9BILA|nr:unnamed protein product [Adineta steineri]